MAYTNKGKIQNYLTTDIDSSLDAFVSDVISSVTLFINSYTQKEFEQNTEDRYFDGNGKNEILIDEFTAINTLEVLDADGDVENTLTEGGSSDFITYPYNKTAKFKIILTPSSTVGSFPHAVKRLKINADWGEDTTVPKDIELAATMLSSQIIKEGKDGGQIKSQQLGDYSVTYDDIDEEADRIGVKKILDSYKIIQL